MPAEHETPSIQELTARQRQAMLRRRESPEGPAAMKIGGHGIGGRVRRVGSRVLAAVGIAAVFVAAFVQFTGSVRIAVMVVGLMLAYMIAVGRMVEGRADHLE